MEPLHDNTFTLLHASHHHHHQAVCPGEDGRYLGHRLSPRWECHHCWTRRNHIRQSRRQCDHIRTHIRHIRYYYVRRVFCVGAVSTISPNWLVITAISTHYSASLHATCSYPYPRTISVKDKSCCGKLVKKNSEERTRSITLFAIPDV